MRDEARADIAIVNADGERRELAKWANDKLRAFDEVYNGLLDLWTNVEHQKPEYDGPYKPDRIPAPVLKPDQDRAATRFK